MGRTLAPPELQGFDAPGHPQAVGGRWPCLPGRSLGTPSHPSQPRRGQRPATTHMVGGCLLQASNHTDLDNMMGAALPPPFWVAIRPSPAQRR